MSSEASSEEKALRLQLVQAQRDKMILLDQLAMVKVTVCFSCQKDLPSMEINLQQTMDRRMTRLNKLREGVVKVSDSLHSEQRYLQKCEEELLELKHQSSKMAKILQQEQEHANDLKKGLDVLMREKKSVVSKKQLESERLKDIRQELGHVQVASHGAQVKSDLIASRQNVAAMEMELKELGDMKENLETEVYAIYEYIRLKNMELGKAKEDLDAIRRVEEGLQKDTAAQLEVNGRVKVKLISAEDDVENLKRQLNSLKDEKICILDCIADEREALEVAKQQEEMTKEDTLRLQQSAKLANHEYIEAKQNFEEVNLELKRCKEKQTKFTAALAAAKVELEESLRFLEFCNEHQKESQETLSSIKCKMLTEFSESRKQLRDLQDERRRLSKELGKANVLAANKTYDGGPEYRVKEICDTLIGGIKRIAPSASLEPVVKHIQTDFAEYLKRHSIAGAESDRSSVASSDDKSAASLKQEVRKKAAVKQDLVAENEQLAMELSEVRKKKEHLIDLKEKEEFQLSSMEDAIASLRETILLYRKQCENLQADANEEKAASEGRRSESSLQKLYKGAVQGLKDPYPNLHD